MAMAGSMMQKGLQDPGIETSANGNSVKTSHPATESHSQSQIQDTGEPGAGPVPIEDIERLLSARRRYQLLPDANDPQPVLEEYDHNRMDFCIVFWVAIVFAMALVVLSALPLFVKTTEDPGLSTAGYTGYSSHQLCMITSLLILSSFGILIYRLLPEVHHWYLKFYHFAIFTIITGVMTYGFVQIVLAHEDMSHEHFGTLHSWLGLTTGFLYYVEFLTGVIYLVGIPMRCDFLGPTFQRFHKILGLIVLFLSVVTVITGISQAPFYLSISVPVKTNPNSIVLNIQGLLAVLFSVAVGTLLLVHQFRRRMRPKWKCIYDNTGQSVRGHESSNTIISKHELFHEFRNQLKRPADNISSLPLNT